MAVLNVFQEKFIANTKKLINAIVPIWISNNLLYRLIRNWLFQGVALMYWSEVIFRFSVEFLLFVLIFVLFLKFFNLIPSLCLSFIIIHTLMWTFNGHFWAIHIGKKKRLICNTPKRILVYLYGLEKRVKRTPSIEGCIIFGSIARGKFHEYSDLDIVFSRKIGFLSSFNAYSAGVRERILAFIYRIPIELYFYDSQAFAITDEGEIPIIIKDTGGKWQGKIPESVWLSKYRPLHEGFFNS